MFLKDSSDRFFIHQDPKEFCAQCNQPVNGKFRLDPFYIIISANDDFYINSNSLQDIPLTINIIDKTFNLLFFTFGGNSNGIEHFRSIFYINRSFYVVDDLNKDLKRKLSSNAKLSSNLKHYFSFHVYRYLFDFNKLLTILLIRVQLC